jgi:hypothetical protein
MPLYPRSVCSSPKMLVCWSKLREASFALDAEEKGIFYELFGLLFDYGPLSDDDVKIARRLHLDIRVWRRLSHAFSGKPHEVG